MSRVIKFRAWYRKDGGYMLSGSEMQTGITGSIDDYFLDADYDFMQFTGLHDVNGVEIYEGDIVEQYHFTDSAGKVQNILHRVLWSDKYDGWFCLNCKSDDENDGSCQLWVYSKTPFTVVGNIYQNPELLEPRP